MMNIDIRKFAVLKKSLENERERLSQRLTEIEAALSGASGRVPSRFAPEPPQIRARARNAAGAISMRDAITAATELRPLRMRDLVEAVQQRGYVFRSGKPSNSLGAYLYSPAGKQHFRKTKEGFSAK